MLGYFYPLPLVAASFAVCRLRVNKRPVMIPLIKRIEALLTTISVRRVVLSALCPTEIVGHKTYGLS